MKILDRIIAATLPLVPRPIVRIVARPYLGGETLTDLVQEVRGLNGHGYTCAASILGEEVESLDDSAEAVSGYEALLAGIESEHLDCNVHIKLSHMGLFLDPEACEANVRRLLASAAEHGNFVRIDMEDSRSTTATLELHSRLTEHHDNVGVVIQARMRRSAVDVQRLAEIQANVRLCKGIYLEPRDIAFEETELIRSNYVALLEDLLSAGCYVGIATHDEHLVSAAREIIQRRGLEPHQYEFQMLHGVTPHRRRALVEEGHRLRVAVPYGPSWYAYSLRRLRKNPAIAGHVARAFFSRKR